MYCAVHVACPPSCAPPMHKAAGGGAYRKFLWDKIELHWTVCLILVLTFHWEAVLLAMQQIHSAGHAADYEAKNLSGRAALRHYAWLRSAEASDDARPRIENFPCHGEDLFRETVDCTVHNLYKKRSTAKRTRFYWPFWRCSYPYSTAGGFFLRDKDLFQQLCGNYTNNLARGRSIDPLMQQRDRTRSESSPSDFFHAEMLFSRQTLLHNYCHISTCGTRPPLLDEI